MQPCPALSYGHQASSSFNESRYQLLLPYLQPCLLRSSLGIAASALQSVEQREHPRRHRHIILLQGRCAHDEGACVVIHHGGVSFHLVTNRTNAHLCAINRSNLCAKPAGESGSAVMTGMLQPYESAGEERGSAIRDMWSLRGMGYPSFCRIPDRLFAGDCDPGQGTRIRRERLGRVGRSA